jgi:hypothetical protein
MRSFVISAPHCILIRSTNMPAGRLREFKSISSKILFGTSERMQPPENLSFDGKIIIKWILKM